MSQTRTDVYEIAGKAMTLPYGPTRLAMLEEAVRIADSLQDIDLGYQMRYNLQQSAEFSARGDVALVSFAWRLAQYDRYPGRFDTHDIMWTYKWTIATCTRLPQVPRDRVMALLDDFEARCRAMGHSMYAANLLRREFLVLSGEREAARSAHAEFRKSRRDSLSDCIACVANGNCQYYLSQNQWRRAIQAAGPVLNGRLRCAEEPHSVLAHVLLPEVKLGQLEEAWEHHREGYRLVRKGRQFVDMQGYHLRFLVLVGDLDAARALLERHIQDALETIMPLDRFQFLLAAALWAERMLREGKTTAMVRMPEAAPPADARGLRDIAAGRDWFLSGAREVADQFDRRNGTDAFARRIDELPELLQPVRARRKEA